MTARLRRLSAFPARIGRRRATAILWKLLAALATLWVLSIVIFLIVNLVPVDAARASLGRSATPEQLALYREEFHLDDPLLTRYGRWLSDVLQGDLGTSLAAREPVATLIGNAAGNSIVLALVAMVFATIAGVLIGVYTGKQAGSRTDVAISTAALVGAAFPPFAVGIFLIVVFGVELEVLPVDSSGAFYGSGWTKAQAYILPAATLAISVAPYIGRMLRTTVHEAMSTPYVRAARLRGVPERRLLWRHVLPVAIGPAVAIIALNLAELLVGLVAIEYIFGFPGLGKLLVDSVGAGDLPLVLALVLLSGTAYILLNSASDFVAAALDPRIGEPA